MRSQLGAFLLGRDLATSQEQVNEQNRWAIHYLAVSGIPVAVVNYGAQMAARGEAHLGPHDFLLLGYFILLMLFDQLVLPKPCKNSTALVYLVEAPVMLVSILLGTVWDPTHPAVTVLMYLMVMPVFILDRPVRIIAVQVAWSALFVALCLGVKDPAMHSGDVLHVLEFLFCSLAVTLVVLRLRMSVVHSLERMRYHLEHDTLTNTRNRYSLALRGDRYLDKPLCLVFGEIDHFSLLNEFYGRETGDELIGSFATILQELFGEGSTYHFGGDALLCVAQGSSADEALALVEECRTRLVRAVPQRLTRPATCTFGYVTGTASTSEELGRMIQLADIYVHQGKRKGEGRTVGGPYTDESFRAGVVESSITSHARAYEVNQLTGLPSMSYFITRCEEMLLNVTDIDRGPLIGYVNIARFRDFNDEFGYAKGDELIRHMADLMRRAFPRRHLTYITGSQFGVLCYRDEVESAMGVLKGELESFVPGHPVLPQAGFAAYNVGDAVISLIDKARLAHKSIEGDKIYRIYDAGLDERVRLRQHVVSNIDRAIEQGWVKVYYQPLISAEDGAVCGMEALSRWDDPQYGMLFPNQFIATLEEESLIYKLTLHVVRTAMADLQRLEAQGIRPMPVSVNLSRNDFAQCDMVDEITRIVDAAGFQHNFLHIEITESAFVETPELLKLEVDRFHHSGFGVWMDDFGSEYSTLNLLQELNFDLVKIDMQFMRNFTETGRNAVIVAAIIDMCRHLGVATLVEGVETHEHYDILRRLGSDMLQGFLFSRPRPLDDLMEYIREHS